jgi:GntR family transcriptional regulator
LKGATKVGEKVLKYSVLKQEIIGMINREELKVNDLIPSERELMVKYDMSRITVRKAIEDLVNEGYLYRIQGKGTYIKSDEQTQDLFSITSCTEDIKRLNMTPSRRVISATVITADKRRARRLQIPDGSLVFQLKRVYYANALPINYTITYIPLNLFPGIEKYNFEVESLYSIMESKYGVKITSAQRTLEAILAHDETAEYLEIKQGEPLILFRCETFGEVNGKQLPIESFKCCYRTDMYKFYINQVR